jgi:hypothetical protein
MTSRHTRISQAKLRVPVMPQDMGENSMGSLRIIMRLDADHKR